MLVIQLSELAASDGGAKDANVQYALRTGTKSLVFRAPLLASFVAERAAWAWCGTLRALLKRRQLASVANELQGEGR